MTIQCLFFYSLTFNNQVDYLFYSSNLSQRQEVSYFFVTSSIFIYILLLKLHGLNNNGSLTSLSF